MAYNEPGQIFILFCQDMILIEFGA